MERARVRGRDYLKGSAHSADPLETHGVVWWCIAGFERFSVSSDPYLDFRLPLVHTRGVIYSMSIEHPPRKNFMDLQGLGLYKLPNPMNL
jgi:hypothetical protein